MIKWGELRRDKDPGYFARMVVEDAKKSILIISDARRPTDLEFFQNQLKEIEIVTVRVEASEKVRASRGWVYTEGVDNVASECGLDGREWDFVIRNDGPNTVPPLNASLEKLLSTIEGKMKEG
uniref:Phosphomevalonate kinase n=2 Tax=Amorphochlora amoebiformis TaxID=1561963 RepID=A0A7S0D2M0_9EUKA|mmetsp:Transcript_18129/g.28880  ORF Transcript_18129/g.28880 Transcript_18129/m.28880 type:complete len:123 (+) Transcript_18129:350-718(+)